MNTQPFIRGGARWFRCLALISWQAGLIFLSRAYQLDHSHRWLVLFLLLFVFLFLVLEIGYWRMGQKEFEVRYWQGKYLRSQSGPSSGKNPSPAPPTRVIGSFGPSCSKSEESDLIILLLRNELSLCPLCHHPWSQHDPADGCCDAGPACKCGHDLLWMRGQIARLSKRLLERLHDPRISNIGFSSRDDQK